VNKLIVIILTVGLSGCVTTSTSASPMLPMYTPEPLPAPIEEREAKSLPAKTGEPTALEKDKPDEVC
jgi:hypothetical protein